MTHILSDKMSVPYDYRHPSNDYRLLRVCKLILLKNKGLPRANFGFVAKNGGDYLDPVVYDKMSVRHGYGTAINQHELNSRCKLMKFTA